MSRASRIIEGLRKLVTEGKIEAFVRFPGEPDHYLVTIMGKNGSYYSAAEAEAFLDGASLQPTKET